MFFCAMEEDPDMTGYALHRLVQMLPIMVLISILVYALLATMPDPLEGMLESNPDMTWEDYERLRELYCLDCPIHERYLAWAKRVVQGDFGYSRMYKIPVQVLVLPRLQNSLILSMTALI